MAVENLSSLRSRSTASLGRITSASGLGVKGDPNPGTYRTYQPLQGCKSFSCLHFTCWIYIPIFSAIPQPRLESTTFSMENFDE
jgi:hypothetical protein